MQQIHLILFFSFIIFISFVESSSYTCSNTFLNALKLIYFFQFTTTNTLSALRLLKTTLFSPFPCFVLPLLALSLPMLPAFFAFSLPVLSALPALSFPTLYSTFPALYSTRSSAAASSSLAASAASRAAVSSSVEARAVVWTFLVSLAARSEISLEKR